MWQGLSAEFPVGAHNLEYRAELAW
jgi:hypothetical protein